MIKKRKLTIINNGYVSSRSLGGGDRYAMEVASRLKGFDITIITPPIGYRHWRKPPKKKVKYKILKPILFDNNPNPIAIFLAYLLRAGLTANLLEKIPKTDLVLSASDLLSDVLPAALYKKSYPKSKWIVHIGHLVTNPIHRQGNFLVNAGSWLLQRLTIRLMRTCDLVIADNRKLRQDLSKFGIDRNKVEIHFSGVDLKNIRSYRPKGKSRFAAVSIGRLAQHKGSFDLPLIWKAVISELPDATLAIVGSGSPATTQALNQEIHALHLEKKIRFLGFLEQKQGNTSPLFEVLYNSKLLLFTDHEAGFGFTVIESMATGTPVVAYDLPIFGTTYKKGFVTAPLKDTKAFAANVIALLQDQRRYAKLRKAAILQAEEFDWKQIIVRLEKSLKRL